MRFFKRQRWACFAFPGRVADHSCKVTYDENCLMPEILKLPKFAENYGMS